MSTLVPSCVSRATEDSSVGDEGRQRPPTATKAPCERSESDDEADPDDRVDKRAKIPALHQLLHSVGSDLGLEPFALGKSAFLGARGFGSDQAVVTGRNGCGQRQARARPE